MRKVTLTLAVVASGLAVAATAAATPPTTTEVSLHRSVPSFLPCPSFFVHGEFDITRRTTTFYDNSGIPIRIVNHVDATGTLSNPLTGKSLPDSTRFTMTTDLVTGTRRFDGKLRVDSAPGEGVVFQVVGRVVFYPDGTMFEAGPHDDLDGNLGALCTYLGTP
jgi:hypothetical protein